MKIARLIYLKDLTLILAIKELKSRYKTSTLGFLWILVNPLIQMVILSLVFSLFLKIRIDNYPLFVFSGLLPWTFFALGTQAGTSSLLSNRDLLKKVSFPKELLPIASTMAHLFIFSLSLALLIVFVILSKGISFNLLLLIPLTLLETLLIIGLSLLLSSFEIYYRDVSFLLQAALTGWFYLTPIVYSIQMVPDQYLWLFQLNPMVGITTAFQSIFLGTPSSFTALLISLLETSLILGLSILIFKQRAKYFADWI